MNLRSVRNSAVAMLLALPLFAQAFTFEFFDFDETRSVAANPLASAMTGTVLHNVKESCLGSKCGPPRHRSPFEETSLYGIAEYSSVSANSSATYNITGDAIKLLWGSPDRYNYIDFFNAEGGQIGTVDGTQIEKPPSGRGLVDVTIFSDETFARFTLRSENSDAFEYAGLSVVPLPAAAWLFGSALLALAGFNSRKRKVRIAR